MLIHLLDHLCVAELLCCGLELSTHLIELSQKGALEKSLLEEDNRHNSYVHE